MKTFILTLIALTAVTNVAKAQITLGPPAGANGTYTLLEPLPCLSSNCDSSNAITKVTWSDYVSYVFNLFIALAAVAAVFMIVWGGFLYVSSSVPGIKSDGLDKVKNAIFGLILVLISYIILRTINPNLVNLCSSLVQPLTNNGIGCTVDQPTLSQAEQYNNSSDQFAQQANSSQSQIDDLQKQNDAYNQQLQQARQDGNEEKMNDIQAAIDNNNNKINDIKAGVISNSGKAAMDTGVTNSLQSIGNHSSNGFAAINTDVANGVSNITAAENQPYSQLDSLGAADSENDLDQRATADKLAIELAGAKLNGNNYSSLNAQDKQTFDNNMSDYQTEIDKITDPTVKQQYQNQYNAIQSKINH